MFEYIEKSRQSGCVICGKRTNKTEVNSGCSCCSSACANELIKEGLSFDKELDVVDAMEEKNYGDDTYLDEVE